MQGDPLSLKGNDIVIMSVSRRTDILNYYSEWFLNRIKEGYLYVCNPINAHQISQDHFISGGCGLHCLLDEKSRANVCKVG